MAMVCREHVPVAITRGQSKVAVLLPLADYESICETSYLLQSPRNAMRLLASIEKLESTRIPSASQDAATV